MRSWAATFLDDKFDEIIEFFGLGRFIESPIRNYYSGLLERLAFSVSSMVEPEIPIVDETLSVGDSTFQEKTGRGCRT